MPSIIAGPLPKGCAEVSPGAQVTITESKYGTTTKRDAVESHVIPFGPGLVEKVTAVVTIRPDIKNTRSGPEWMMLPSSPIWTPVSVI